MSIIHPYNFIRKDEFGFGFGTGAVGRYFAPNAVNFDGVGAYLERDGNFTDIVNADTFLLSMWAKYVGSDGIWCSQFCDYGANYCYVAKSPFNLFQTYFTSVMGGALYFYNATSVTSSNGWIHVMISCKMSGTKILQFYLNDVSDLGSVYDSWPMGGDNINFASAINWYVGAGVLSLNRHNGDMGELVINLGGPFIDLSDVNNRRKFISDTGQPVYLGPNGEIPFGVPPTVYLSQPNYSTDADQFATNLGSGGGFFPSGGNTLSNTKPGL